MLTNVRNNVELPSLWKTIIIDAFGRSPSNLECALQLKKKDFHEEYVCVERFTDHFEYQALHDLKQFDH